jgi:hypothetical protein
MLSFLMVTPPAPLSISISGLPDFSWSKIPKWRKIYQITTKYTKWSYNISNGRKIYPNRDFWFENKPSGNPAPYVPIKPFEVVQDETRAARCSQNFALHPLAPMYAGANPSTSEFTT